MNGASRAGQRPVSQLTEINRIEPNLPEYRRTTSQTRAYLDTTPKYFNINQQFYLLLHCLMIIRLWMLMHLWEIQSYKNAQNAYNMRKYPKFSSN